MVIKTELTVNGYKATVSPKLLLHKGDSVFLEITLMNTIINTIEGVEVDEVMPMQFLRDVKLLLQNPNGVLNVKYFKSIYKHNKQLSKQCFNSDEWK